ncbi:MAG: DUF748 domain-containing protein [Nitrospira sp.]|nr:DUF748 domain-containing protein [Nitrospira sp.]
MCSSIRCQASLSLKLGHIGLRPFQPYLDRTMQVDIMDGEVELDGEVTYRSRPESEPMFAPRHGPGGVNNLHVADHMSGKNFWDGPRDCRRWRWTSHRPRSRSAKSHFAIQRFGW